MIELRNASKSFGKVSAVRDVSFRMKEENVFGLVGTNGAGKSTVLRMAAGVLKPDEGLVLVDGMNAHATPRDMEKYYSSVYERFNREAYYMYLASFGLDSRRKIESFSKGMKKQLALICGISSQTKYLLCDETFDGLDPVMRQGIKSIFAQEMEKRGLTPVIASHNLRELEDICDHVGLLHQGGILLSRELEEMKCNIQKVQCVFASGEEAERMLRSLTLVKQEKRGSLYTLTVRGERDEIIAMFAAAETHFYEVLPLSLEEIFISETEVKGYDVKKLLLG